MKHLFPLALFVSSILMQAMQENKNISVFLRAFPHNTLFAVPNHIVHMCKTLKDPINDYYNEQNNNSFILKTKSSPEIIEKTLNYLSSAYNLQNHNSKPPEKEITWLLQDSVDKPKDLVEMIELIHYLNPLNENLDEFNFYGKNPNKIMQKARDTLKVIYEKALINSAIHAQQKNCAAFTYLNPDISPKNVTKFLIESSLVPDIFSHYCNQPPQLSNVKYPHRLLNKSYDNDNIINILYCTDEQAIYAVHNKYKNNNITFIAQTLSEEWQTTIEADYIYSFCANDNGTCIVCETNDNLISVFPKEQRIYPMKVRSYCTSNENVYYLVPYAYAHNSSKYVYAYKNNIIKCVYTVPSATDITSDMHDAVVACNSSKELYILQKHGDSEYVNMWAKLPLEEILDINNNSFEIKKISVSPCGIWLYIVVQYPNNDVRDYLYNIKNTDMHRLGTVAKNKMLTHIQWSPSFVIRAYSVLSPHDALIQYTITHLATGKNFYKTTNTPFIGFTKNAKEYIEKQLINDKHTYFSFPLIDESLKNIGLFFDKLASPSDQTSKDDEKQCDKPFATVILLDKLIKNNNPELDHYEHYLYQKLPQELRSLLPAQEKNENKQQ